MRKRCGRVLFYVISGDACSPLLDTSTFPPLLSSFLPSSLFRFPIFVLPPFRSSHSPSFLLAVLPTSVLPSLLPKFRPFAFSPPFRPSSPPSFFLLPSNLLLSSHFIFLLFLKGKIESEQKLQEAQAQIKSLHAKSKQVIHDLKAQVKRVGGVEMFLQAWLRRCLEWCCFFSLSGAVCVRRSDSLSGIFAIVIFVSMKATESDNVLRVWRPTRLEKLCFGLSLVWPQLYATMIHTHIYTGGRGLFLANEYGQRIASASITSTKPSSGFR